MGRLAKTDTIDARMRSEFTSGLIRCDDLPRLLRLLPDPEQRPLADLVMRRRPSLAMRLPER